MEVWVRVFSDVINALQIPEEFTQSILCELGTMSNTETVLLQVILDYRKWRMQVNGIDKVAVW